MEKITHITFRNLIEAVRAEYYDPEATRLAIALWDRLTLEILDREGLLEIAKEGGDSFSREEFVASEESRQSGDDHESS